jgi:hypothetical protein
VGPGDLGGLGHVDGYLRISGMADSSSATTPRAPSVGAVAWLGAGGLDRARRDSYLNLVAERLANREVKGKVGNPPVQRSPPGRAVGVTAEQRNEGVDCRLPEIEPVPGWADGETDLHPERAVRQLPDVTEPVRYLLLEVIAHR